MKISTRTIVVGCLTIAICLGSVVLVRPGICSDGFALKEAAQASDQLMLGEPIPGWANSIDDEQNASGLLTIHFDTIVGLLTAPTEAASNTQGQNPRNGTNNKRANGVWVRQVSPARASLRGLVAIDANTAWASGTGGTVLRTVDGGENWIHVPVPGVEALDFRNLHAWDADNALVISAGFPTEVYRTRDGGTSWQRRYGDSRHEAFVNAVAFWDANRGLAFGDPIDNRLLLLATRDGGWQWGEVPTERQPAVAERIIGFAASGTALTVREQGRAWIGLGGAVNGQPTAATILRSVDYGQTWEAVQTPIQGHATAGIFSIFFIDDSSGVAVGGDFEQPGLAASNILITNDGGQTWRVTEGTPPRGYRSAVTGRRIDSGWQLVAVGVTGTDISDDQGENWRAAGDEPYHAVAFTPDGAAGWAVGPEGRISQWREPLR